MTATFMVLGIDPGLTGAIACVGANGSAAVHPLPTKPNGRGGMVQKRIDGRALVDLVLQLVPVGVPCFAVVEEIAARPREGRAATPIEASLHTTSGVILGVLDTLRLRIEEVSPQTWHRWYGLGADKDANRRHAIELYPALGHELRRVADHNKAEAVLLAHYGLRRLA